MTEVSESINKKNLVIKKQIDKYLKIITIAEKKLKRNLMGDLTEYDIKKNIEEQIRLIVVYMSYVDVLKQPNVPLISAIRDRDRLRKNEQEVRKKFHVPISIPVVFK